MAFEKKMKRMLHPGLDLMKRFYCSWRLKCWSGLCSKLIHPQSKGAEEMLITEGKNGGQSTRTSKELTFFFFLFFHLFGTLTTEMYKLNLMNLVRSKFLSSGGQKTVVNHRM